METEQRTMKKKWGVYLFEFFMLFAAVSLGFIVDNLREEAGLREREQQYIRLLIQDLQADSLQCEQLMLRFAWKTGGLDSLLASFDLRSENRFSSDGYRLIQRHLGGFPDFVPTNGTMLQLKNGGGLITIRNPLTVKKILEYDGAVQLELMHQEAMNTFYLDKIWTSLAASIDLQGLQRLSERQFQQPEQLIMYNDRRSHISFSNDVTHYRKMTSLQLTMLESVLNNAKGTARISPPDLSSAIARCWNETFPNIFIFFAYLELCLRKNNVKIHSSTHSKPIFGIRKRTINSVKDPKRSPTSILPTNSVSG